MCILLRQTIHEQLRRLLPTTIQAHCHLSAAPSLALSLFPGLKSPCQHHPSPPPAQGERAAWLGLNARGGDELV